MFFFSFSSSFLDASLAFIPASFSVTRLLHFYTALVVSRDVFIYLDNCWDINVQNTDFNVVTPMTGFNRTLLSVMNHE